MTGSVGTGVWNKVDEPFIDVLVRMEALGPDRYELDDERLRVIGVRSGDRIGLGDAMRIQVDDVSIRGRPVFGRRLPGLEQEIAEHTSLEGGEEIGEQRPKRRVKKTGTT